MTIRVIKKSSVEGQEVSLRRDDTVSAILRRPNIQQFHPLGLSVEDSSNAVSRSIPCSDKFVLSRYLPSAVDALRS